MALSASAVGSIIAIIVITSHAGSQWWVGLGAFSFVVSCAASSFAFLAVFIRFVRSRVKLYESLRDNSYGIYLVHYVFVSWLQYALLGAPVSAIAKASIVFAGALVLSWATSAAARRVPSVW